MNTVNEAFYHRDGRNLVIMIHLVQVFCPLISIFGFLGFYAYYWCIIKKGSVNYEDLDTRDWSTVAAYYLVSLYFTLFVFFGLDCAAAHYQRIGTDFITDNDNFVVAPMVFDAFAVVFIVALLAISRCCSNKWQLICLGLAGFAPLLCIASHAHYIVIAWTTAPSYAYGIGVFYAIMFFVYFFTFKFVYYIDARYSGCSKVLYKIYDCCCCCCCCCKKSEDQTENSEDQMENSEDQMENSEDQIENSEDQMENSEDQKEKSDDKQFSYVALILPFTMGLFLTGFFVMIACFVVLIPITESIEDASRQVSVIYQGIIFILTGVLAYLVFKPKEKKKKKKKKKKHTLSRSLRFYRKY